MHGAGSPQAQRVQIARQMQIEFKKVLARTLAGIVPTKKDDKLAEEVAAELSEYMARVFQTDASNEEL